MNFVRHSRCERYKARYEATIAEILQQVVERLNIQCDCVQRHWMVCQVSTTPEQHDILRARLDPDLPEEQMRPLQIMDFSLFFGGLVPMRPMITYTQGRCNVFAEIVLRRMNQRVTLAERLQVGSQIMQGPDEDQGAEGSG